MPDLKSEGFAFFWLVCLFVVFDFLLGFPFLVFCLVLFVFLEAKDLEVKKWRVFVPQVAESLDGLCQFKVWGLYFTAGSRWLKMKVAVKFREKLEGSTNRVPKKGSRLQYSVPAKFKGSRERFEIKAEVPTFEVPGPK